MNKLVSVLVTCFFGFMAYAETPWNRAIGSEAALESYAQEQSTRAQIGIWGGEHIVSITNASQYVYVYSADPLKLADLVSNQELGIGIVNGSTNPLYKSCQFYNKNYRLMYYGFTEGMVINVSGNNIISFKELDMIVPNEIQMDLPPEYDWAYVYLRYTDENGNEKYIYLGQGKEFNWRSSFSGLKNARLVISGYNSSGFPFGQVVDVGSGEFLPIEEFIVDFHSIVMDGFSYHTNGVVYTVGATNSIGRSPLFQLETTGLAKTLISVKTSENEKPSGFFYRKVGGEGKWPQWEYFELNGFSQQYIYLPAGTYHIDFKWPLLHSEDWKKNQYNDGGGRG